MPKKEKLNMLQCIEQEPEINLVVDAHKRLLWAVLERAVSDLTEKGACDLGATKSKSRRVRIKTFDWFLSEEEHPWSFIWVCRNLGISKERFIVSVEKLGLLNWSERYAFPSSFGQKERRGRRIK